MRESKLFKHAQSIHVGRSGAFEKYVMKQIYTALQHERERLLCEDACKNNLNGCGKVLGVLNDRKRLVNEDSTEHS